MTLGSNQRAVADLDAIRTWKVPTELSMQKHQLSIVEECLFSNALVFLSPPLDRFVITSAVLCNFLRWFPLGKVCFVTSTKPAIAQQRESLLAAGIEPNQVIELNGAATAQARSALWRRFRIFFLSPQIFYNDLQCGSCPASQVVCVVVDEAHRAQRESLTAQSIAKLATTNEAFRVVAFGDAKFSSLSAAAVQSIISNLMIERLELRSEENAGVHGFSFSALRLPLSGPLLQAKGALEENLLAPATKKLAKSEAIPEQLPPLLETATILRCRQAFRLRHQGVPVDAVERDFSALLCFYQSYDLLVTFGLIPWLSHASGMKEGEGPFSDPLQKTCKLVEELVGRSSLEDSHPKVSETKNFLLQLFANGASAARALVLVSDRETAVLLHQLCVSVRQLERCAKALKGSKPSSTEKAKLVSDFKSGNINILIYNYIEKDIFDTGEIDLVVFFDSQIASDFLHKQSRRPWRRSVLLLTEGLEKEPTLLANQVAEQPTPLQGSFRFCTDPPKVFPAGTPLPEREAGVSLRPPGGSSDRQLPPVARCGGFDFSVPEHFRLLVREAFSGIMESEGYEIPDTILFDDSWEGDLHQA